MPVPEWRNPDRGAIPLEYADILKAENKTPQEIQAIENDLEAVNGVERFLAAR